MKKDFMNFLPIGLALVAIFLVVSILTIRSRESRIRATEFAVADTAKIAMDSGNAKEAAVLDPMPQAEKKVAKEKGKNISKAIIKPDSGNVAAKSDSNTSAKPDSAKAIVKADTGKSATDSAKSDTTGKTVKTDSLKSAKATASPATPADSAKAKDAIKDKTAPLPKSKTTDATEKHWLQKGPAKIPESLK